MVLSFQNITHELGGNTLFTEVGATMLDGALLIVKGANGAGKTTLLKILTGLTIPRYGFVFDGEMEISEDYRKYFSELQFIGHQNAIDPELTVEENIKFWASLGNREDAYDACIKFLKIEKYLKTPCKYLSAGWQRRVALSRLMLNKSRLWFMDEPFTNLDEEMVDIMLKMIATFCDQGGICIISCHQEVNLPFGMELQISDFAPCA